MELLAALGMGAKELFTYNRENFKFDQDQRLERESLRLEMQVKRFELFREDVRDLVELTVDRMDVYHLVGALFLEFCIVLFCEGRVQASAPPFLLSLFLLSNACAFIYLLLAVWLSMHASIAAHSFGVRLLTRFVRLPIPSLRQMDALRSQLRDYEKQGVANLLRLPFQDKQDWKQRGDEDASASPPAGGPVQRVPASYLVAADGGGGAAASSGAAASAAAAPFGGPSAGLVGKPAGGDSGGAHFAPAASAAAPRRPDAAANLLPEEAEHPLGGEDLLRGLSGARPERHVQLFRQLQAKWQCYDAYCRVCMGLGVNQILQGLSYYCICHTLVENRSPTTGYALVVMLQCTTVALAVLDLAGLKRREIIVVQVIGIMPCALTAWGIAHGRRDERGVMDPEQDYMMSPLSFLLQVLWLELWLRVAAPSGEDTAKLPRRFRQILFLDVFGDAVGWDPSQAENENQPDSKDYFDRSVVDDIMNDEEKDREMEGENEALHAAAEQAASQVAMAQCAVRRWSACPDWSLSEEQQAEFDVLKEKLTTWGSAIHGELERYRHYGSADSVFEPELRPWYQLTLEERHADPFAKCLVGPFESHEGYVSQSYHYDVETSHTLYGDAATKERPGALVLTLQAVSTIIEDLEKEARRLLEMRVMRDLHAATRRQQAVARERRRGAAQHRAAQPQHRSESCPESSAGAFRRAPTLASLATPATAARQSFPNLLSILRRRRRPRQDREQGVELLATSSPGGAGDAPHRAATAMAPALPSPPGGPPAAASAGGPRARDPTLVAMAGQHARHFVPERLPWQVLSRMTRVLQACWLWSGLMALLKEAHVYQVDFQQHPGHERRLLGASPGARLEFERLDVEWPRGSFFRSQGLFCPSVPQSGDVDVWIGSPFALHGAASEGGKVQLSQLASAELPPSAAALCPPLGDLSGWPSTSAPAPPCLFAAPAGGDDGLTVWRMGRSPYGSEAVRLPAEGAPWQLATGGLVRCAHAAALMPSSGEDSSDDVATSPAAEWCLVLAGWDGELLPVAVVPLPGGLGSLPAAGEVLRPGLDVPLAPTEAEQGVLGLHFEPRSGRLWALLASGGIEAWDLFAARPLGRTAPRWPRPRQPPAGASPSSFRPAAVCEDSGRALFVLGRRGAEGPQLLRAALPEGFTGLGGPGGPAPAAAPGSSGGSFRGLAAAAGGAGAAPAAAAAAGSS